MPIRILHLSDINVGGREFERWQGGFVKYLSDVKDLSEIPSVDYLIICGNITCDGKQDHFEKAAEIIKSIADEWLPGDTSLAHQWNRLVLVPGQKDVSQTPADAFSEFYIDLCSHYAGGSEDTSAHLDPSLPIIRQLKDLTVVGLAYWNPSEPDPSESAFEHFASLLGEIPDSIDSIEYTKHTPTLLVTSESPLLAPALSQELTYQRVCRVLQHKLKPDLHLIGAAPETCFSIESFALKHIGLATGPRSPDGYWPFRMNLVTFSLPSDPVGNRDGLKAEREKRSSFFTVQSYRRYGADWDWKRSEAPIPGSLDSLIHHKKRHWPKPAPGYLPYLSSLRDKLDRARTQGGLEKIVLVETLPGSFFGESLTNVPPLSIDGKEYAFVTQRYGPKVGEKFEKGAIDRENLLRDINESITAIVERAETLGRDNCMVVIQDDAFEEIETGSLRRDWLDLILGELKTLVAHKTALILYAVRPVESTCLALRFPDRLTVDKPDPNTIRKLLDHFLSRIPISEDDGSRLSGIHSGFRDAVFQPLQEEFNMWSGAETIDDSSSSRLIGQAFLKERNSKERPDRLYKLTKAFYHTFQKEYKAPVRLIQERLVRELQQVVKERRSIGDVHVDIQKDFGDALNSHEKQGLERMLSLLQEHGVVGKVRNTPAYTLEVLAPFILQLPRSSEMETLTAKMGVRATEKETLTPDTEASSAEMNARAPETEARGSELKPTRICNVFISYRTRDQVRVKEVVDKLGRRLLNEDRVKLQSYIFDRPSKAARSVSLAIEKAIDDCPNLIVFVAKKDDFKAEWIRNELYYFRRTKKKELINGEALILVVSLTGVEIVHVGVSDLPTIKHKPNDPGSVVTEIKECLLKCGKLDAIRMNKETDRR